MLVHPFDRGETESWNSAVGFPDSQAETWAEFQEFRSSETGNSEVQLEVSGFNPNEKLSLIETNSYGLGLFFILDYLNDLLLNDFGNTI